ncbi:MAG: hypothetical protein EZS28_038398, partial [Streblomastix strix]
IYSDVDDLILVSASSNRDDNEDVSKRGAGQGVGGDCGSDGVRVVVDESSESDVSEESVPGIGEADPEAEKVNG